MGTARNLEEMSLEEKAVCDEIAEYVIEQWKKYPTLAAKRVLVEQFAAYAQQDYGCLDGVGTIEKLLLAPHKRARRKYAGLI